MLPYEQFLQFLRNGSPQVPRWSLKRFLLILSDRIFDSSVACAIPSFAAAPDGPNTRPRHSRRAASMIFSLERSPPRRDKVGSPVFFSAAVGTASSESSSGPLLSLRP